MKGLVGVTLMVALSQVLSGCGYALAGRGSFLPSDIRVVGIPLLENRTPVARLDQIFTEKIRTEFIERSFSHHDAPSFRELTRARSRAKGGCRPTV